jgi:DnaJ-class molecular chaperone
MEHCKTCEGRGWVEKQVRYLDGSLAREIAQVPCPDCDGETTCQK